MYNYFSKKIVNMLISRNYIPSESGEMYEYCFVLVLSTVTSVLSIILISILTKTVLPSVIILISFLACRMCCGGYHAKNHLLCYITTLVNHLCCLGLYLLFLKHSEILFILVINAFSLFSLFFFAPAENSNNPMSDSQRRHHVIQCRVIAVLSAVLCVLEIYFPPIQSRFFCASVGIFSASLSMIVSLIINNSKGGEKIEKDTD